MNPTRPGTPMSRHMTRGVAGTFLFTLACLGLTSCTRGDRPRVYPVQGQLLFDGHPVEGALLVLHPVATGPSSAHPTARTAADGSFHVTSYRAGDGAAEGEYVVTAEWRPLVTKPESPDPEPGPNRLPSKYADARTSPLRAKVNAGPTDLASLELTDEPAR